MNKLRMLSMSLKGMTSSLLVLILFSACAHQNGNIVKNDPSTNRSVATQETPKGTENGNRADPAGNQAELIKLNSKRQAIANVVCTAKDGVASSTVTSQVSLNTPTTVVVSGFTIDGATPIQAVITRMLKPKKAPKSNYLVKIFRTDSENGNSILANGSPLPMAQEFITQLDYDNGQIPPLSFQYTVERLQMDPFTTIAQDNSSFVAAETDTITVQCAFTKL